MNKSFMYVAAIALLTAGTAFAQSAAPGVNGSTINNSTPTPAAQGAAEGAPRTSTGAAGQSGSMMNQSGSGSSSMGSGSSMNSDMDHSGRRSKSSSRARMHHVASNHGAGIDSKEDQETMKLNRQQLASGAGGGMNSSSNSFDNGSPQQAQAGGANCTPDNMSCGTARENPAIKSSPQQRTYGNQQ
jgi:hypothetical protein